MYQWKKFEFFEEKAPSAVLPEEVAGTITCCTSGRGSVSVGCDDGSVSVLDRGLRFSHGFRAHAGPVLFLQQLKVFDLDKTEAESSSETSPVCVQIMRVFTNQFPEAKITSFLVLEEAPPILLVAIGLDNGCVYCIKGDFARERINRFKLQVENVSEKGQLAITGLGFRVEGQAHQLFAVTPASVSLFSLHDQPPKRQTLDQIGCETNGVTMSDRLDLIVGRPEAVYFYEVDGRDQRSGKDTFNVYDLKNRLIAHSMMVGDVMQMLCEWGNIFLIMRNKRVLCIGEKDMESKLDMLFKKNLYTVAINLVQSQQADAAATAEVLRKYGDHLYGKQDYDEAMAQYIHTIGHLEPSYVIQKFLDAQRIYNLTNYLEKLHERGLASKDHTTLLLNCYTKLKDVEKLNQFIRGEDGIGEHKFDVETAIKVCRAAGYHEHAMYVAKKFGRHEWYLKILLEDLGSYQEALQYISSLDPSQAGMTVKQYGKILVEHMSFETTEILLGLCTAGQDSSKKRTSNDTYLSILPSPVDFADIFIHNPQAHMNFLEKIIGNAEGANVSSAESKGKSSVESSNKDKEKDRLERFNKGLRLLKSAWPSDMEHPLYDDDHAVVLCARNAFNDGLLFLYEKKKLYKEVIGCYKNAHDHDGLITCCKRLGDSSKGGDPSLWKDVLNYFGDLGEDCSKEVKEVLTYIERDDLLPPIVVLQILSRNPCLTLSVVKDYIAHTSTMRKEIQDLRTNARIFQLSKCTACTFTLDLPAVHFMCMHSFHQRCLGDNEKECPECAPEYRSVLETKRRLEQSVRDPSQFFQQVRNSKDGFSVIADYFGKGTVSKTRDVHPELLHDSGSFGGGGA
ncbi:hypothetical protein QJS10_CPA10g01849 [Acorus calamus]|uniref:Vacuolar protein sorting-associated protein 11 homolog n=1 Tax=Acorus calamus TaxID=4465 RepID=A0AAV9E029_ACOCL|nr:hypothetical protein QJS10_CPA10g01849 [Acorus calamus]